MKLSLLSLLSIAACLATTASAATATNLPPLSQATPQDSASAPGASQTQPGGKSSKTDSSSASTPTPDNNQHTQSVSSQESTAKITGSGSAASNTGTKPTISGNDGATDTGLPTDLPTVAGAFVIVAPSVPPTANAPFMQQSSMPEGTVFIAVGAILGFLAMSVILWRGLVAWALHRSVKRAAMAQNLAHEKSMFRPPVPSFYRYKDHESSLSLANMKNTNRKSARPPTANGSINQSSLFFSPTAGAATNNPGGARGSNYLPAGYYAAGVAQPGSGQGPPHIGHHPSISMTNLVGRDSYARVRSTGPSPPGTPLSSHHAPSSSTVHLTRAPSTQRAPSAYLDDLFDREEEQPPIPVHDQRI